MQLVWLPEAMALAGQLLSSMTLTYDALNPLKALNGYSYQLGPTGNRTSATEASGRTLNWTYDGIYRLTNETVANDPNSNNGTVAYGLDPVGNRLSITSTLPNVFSGNFSFNANDWLSAETYDNNGNVLTSNGHSFQYDFANRLKSANSGAITLVYDGDGNRVAKTFGGVTTQYLIDDLNPTGLPQVIEEVVYGAVQRTYTYGLQRINENQLIGGVWTPSFYSYDGGGNVRALTNIAGTITDTYNYDAFGNIVNRTGSTPNNYLYRGEQFDADLGLYYLRARYYNPASGRFLGTDPDPGNIANPASFHRYIYAAGDAVNKLDPTGRTTDTAEYAEIEATEIAPRPDGPGPVIGGLAAVATFVTCVFEKAAVGLGYANYALQSPSVPLLLLDATCGYIAHPGQAPEPLIAPSAPGIPNQPTPPTPTRSCQPGEHRHHMLPQNPSMKAWFAAYPRYLDVDDPQFIECLPPPCHTGKGGVHSNQDGPGTNWNARWQWFMDTYPNASAADVVTFLNLLKQEFYSPLNCQ